MMLVPFNLLSLNSEHHRQIRAIRHENQKRNWEITGKIMDIEAKLEGLHDTDADPRKIGEAFSRIVQLERQKIENDVRAWNHARALLTAKQKERLKELNRDSYGSQQDACDVDRASGATLAGYKM